MADNLIHFRPSDKTGNVRCLNGSAHVRQTFDINSVTCPLCKDIKTNSSFWFINGVPKYRTPPAVYTRF